MKRIFLLGIICTILALHAGTALAQTLKIATPAPDGTSATQTLRDAAKEVETATQGRVQVKVYAGGVMGSDAQMMRKMHAGQLHGAIFTSGSLAHEDFNFGLLALPMLLTSPAQADAARAEVEKDLVARMAKKGYICTGFIEVGFAYVMGNLPIATPDDMKKARPWLPEGSEITGDIFKAFGVTPIPLSLPDVLTALQTGVIDTVGTPPIAAVALQWFTRIKYVTDTPLLYAYASLAFSERALGQLSPEDRATVMDIFTRRMDQVDKQVRLDNAAALKTLKDQGIEFVQVSPESRQEFQRVTAGLIDSYRDRGDLDPALLERARKAAEAAQENTGG
ncbi:MAG: TRAP transporter substrate-binding protein DctP [Desulfovibrionaceae bacterium]